MLGSNAVRSLVELHEIEVRRFCEVGDKLRASGTPLPETDDPSYLSAVHLGGHVSRAARHCLAWIGEFVSRPVADVDSATDAVGIARKGRVFVDGVLPASQMLEPAVVLPMRRRIQRERLTSAKASAAP